MCFTVSNSWHTSGFFFHHKILSNGTMYSNFMLLALLNFNQISYSTSNIKPEGRGSNSIFKNPFLFHLRQVTDLFQVSVLLCVKQHSLRELCLGLHVIMCLKYLIYQELIFLPTEVNVPINCNLLWHIVYFY